MMRLRHITRETVAVSLAAALALTSPHNGTAEVYSWTDKDGVTHFSDNPPEDQPYQRRAMPRALSSFVDKARDLALMWEQASPYGGRCDMEEVRRVELLYQELYQNAQHQLQLCKEGWAEACRALRIPTHLNILNSTATLQAYLPPPNIRSMVPSGYSNANRKWSCR
ncbi:MAG: DUF4124 domain-containing protein [Nitrospira defluvii]|nr:DUF4124 domain-containing protein [Nitrospira defluvii]